MKGAARAALFLCRLFDTIVILSSS